MRNPEGIVCPIPLQWGQSFEFKGEGAGFSVMCAISSTTWIKKKMKKQVTLWKQENIGTTFNWDIATYMHLLPLIPLPPTI